MNRFNSELLTFLENLSSEEINNALDELQVNLSIRFGYKVNRYIKVLELLKEVAEHKELSLEVSSIKFTMLDIYSKEVGVREARVKTFNTWVSYQNQGKSLAFVRDGLKKELAQIQKVGASV